MLLITPSPESGMRYLPRGGIWYLKMISFYGWSKHRFYEYNWIQSYTTGGQSPLCSVWRRHERTRYHTLLLSKLVHLMACVLCLITELVIWSYLAGGLLNEHFYLPPTRHQSPCKRNRLMDGARLSIRYVTRYFTIVIFVEEQKVPHCQLTCQILGPAASLVLDVTEWQMVNGHISVQQLILDSRWNGRFGLQHCWEKTTIREVLI